MCVTKRKLENPARGHHDVSRSLLPGREANSVEAGPEAMACFCGRIVENAVLGDGSGIAPHRPRVLFKDGIRQSRKDRKAGWCVIPGLLAGYVARGAVVQ